MADDDKHGHVLPANDDEGEGKNDGDEGDADDITDDDGMDDAAEAPRSPLPSGDRGAAGRTRSAQKQGKYGLARSATAVIKNRARSAELVARAKAKELAADRKTQECRSKHKQEVDTINAELAELASLDKLRTARLAERDARPATEAGDAERTRNSTMQLDYTKPETDIERKELQEMIEQLEK